MTMCMWETVAVSICVFATFDAQSSARERCRNAVRPGTVRSFSTRKMLKRKWIRSHHNTASRTKTVHVSHRQTSILDPIAKHTATLSRKNASPVASATWSHTQIQSWTHSASPHANTPIPSHGIYIVRVVVVVILTELTRVKTHGKLLLLRHCFCGCVWSESCPWLCWLLRHSRWGHWPPRALRGGGVLCHSVPIQRRRRCQWLSVLTPTDARGWWRWGSHAPAVGKRRRRRLCITSRVKVGWECGRAPISSRIRFI